MIAIEFTRDEWSAIRMAVEDHSVQWMSHLWEMEVNIIDRIEKALGVE